MEKYKTRGYYISVHEEGWTLLSNVQQEIGGKPSLTQITVHFDTEQEALEWRNQHLIVEAEDE